MRTGMILLGIGLGLLWLVGLGYQATPWLTWGNLVAALLSLGTGLLPNSAVSALKASPFTLGGLLVVLWIVGLASGASLWLTWWTFVFGVAYLLFGVATLGERPFRRTAAGPRGA